MAPNRRTESLVARDVHFTYPYTGEKVLDGASVTVRRGEITGLVGRNESGKTSLARILCRAYEPDSGCLIENGSQVGEEPRPYWVWPLYAVLLAAFAALVAALRQNLIASRSELQRLLPTARGRPAALVALLVRFAAAGIDVRALVLVLALALLAVAEVALRSRRGAARTQAFKRRVALVTSEDSPGRKFPGSSPIREVLCGLMPKRLTPAERVERGALLLRAGGLQLYDREGKPYGSPAEYVRDDRITMARCSGGQKHLVYVLRMLASEPDYVLADEILIGLDVPTQARVLLILQYMSTVRRAGVLFIATDLVPVELVCKSVVFMRRGQAAIPEDTAKFLFQSEQKASRAYAEAARSAMTHRQSVLLRTKVEESLRADVRGVLERCL